MDVLGVLGFVLAAISLAWQWWTRHTAPDQELRIRKAIRAAEREEALRPTLRSSVLGALQFLHELPDPLHIAPLNPEMPINILIPKEATRLEALVETWRGAADIVDERQTRAWDAVHAEGELLWLRSVSGELGEDRDIYRRLEALKRRLERLLDTLR
jgi:hypothetical protein